jgi:hypothetical protein
METVFDIILFIFYALMLLYSLVVIIIPIVKFLREYTDIPFDKQIHYIT